MPANPSTWLDQFTVNLTTTGNQYGPRIVQLANGNILVSWTSSDNTGVGSANGTDIIGQIFDPMGTRIGVEFQLNTEYQIDSERAGELAALPDGGFVMVYEDNESTGNQLRMQRYDATGVSVNYFTIASDYDAVNAPDYFTPIVATSSATSVLIVYEKYNGTNTEMVGAIYNPSTDTIGSEFGLLTGGNYNDPSVAVLANGNYAIVTTKLVDGDYQINYRVVDIAGNNVVVNTWINDTHENTYDDYEASITALTGGGFVISYTNTDSSDTDIYFKIFNATGSVVGGSVVDAGATTDNNNETVVVALADGGFVLIYDDDEADVGIANHYDANGTFLGSFTFTASGTEYSAITLKDGRIAVIWMNAASEVAMEILDTRDAINSGNYTPDTWQIGTNDHDTILGGSDIVHGWNGNDTITESGAVHDYYGDAGDDTIKVMSVINSDLHNGGSGDDTIDWSGSGVSNGVVYNLAAGTATQGGSVEDMIAFENLIGSAANETIIGTSGINTLDGGSGLDNINAGGGNDFIRINQAQTAMGSTYNGGADTDTLKFDSNTSYSYDIRDDFLVSIETLDLDDPGFGGSATVRLLASQLTGITTIKGNSYTDVSDTFLINMATSTTLDLSGITIELMNQVGDAFKIIGDDDAETFVGSAGVDKINGLGGNDSLDGRAGADVLTGGAGNDTYYVDNVGDIVAEVAAEGTDLVRAAISYTLTTDVEQLQLMGSSGINGTGNALSNVISGNNFDNIIDGKAGADIMGGAGGNDTYTIDNVGDVVKELAGGGTADLVKSSIGYTLTAEVEKLILTGSANINATGNGLNNIIAGNAGANIIDGGTGADTMAGQAGNDTYIIDNAGDIVTELAGGGTADLVKSSISYTMAAEVEKLLLTGTDLINASGNALANVIAGNGVRNALDGKGGSDTLAGGAGTDVFIFSTALGVSNVDHITDYSVVDDSIRLSQSIFSTLGLGALNANAFKDIASGAIDANDRIIYNHTTGELFYDIDGSGASSAVLFAVIDNHALLTASEFTLV